MAATAATARAIELRRSPRKRHISSIPNASVTDSPASRTRSRSRSGKRSNASKNAGTTTPRRPGKKVRISDPGPSTGLTPAMMRTSFDGGNTGSVPSTPSRRRRSIPASRKSTQRVMQFTPLRQALDPRVQRRIGRMGLSNEINHIEREKRDFATYEKRLQSLVRSLLLRRNSCWRPHRKTLRT